MSESDRKRAPRILVGLVVLAFVGAGVIALNYNPHGLEPGDPRRADLRGAGFVVPVAGKISLMPGTGSNPAYRRVDVDTDTGKVKGVF